MAVQASPHVFLYDFRIRRWVNVWLWNRPPPRCYGHSANIVGRNVYFFGGARSLSSDPTSILNSMFRLNVDTWEIFFDGPPSTACV